MPDASLLNTLTQYIESARAKARDGLTVAELAQLTISGMRLAIIALEKIDMPGADKKTEVLKLVEYFFDQFADACVPIYAKPVWWVVRPAVRALILSVASGAVESILIYVRSV
jgi:hypothetical protein